LPKSKGLYCRGSGRKERSDEICDLGAPIAQLQRVRDAAAASTSPAESAYADLLRLRAGTAKALAAEIENLLS
jgi:hypothetical protein